VYYKVTLKIPFEILPEVEEKFYLIASSGWEERDFEGVREFSFYFKDKDLASLEALEKFVASYPQIKISYTLVKEENWAELWKANFRPLKVGQRLVIVPPWESYVPEKEEVVIFIEPGQAFGTGHHPTTQMMLEHIEKYFFEKQNAVVKVLDLGCGTGILSIACALLCPGAEVVAVDIDEEALKATLYNAKLNKVEKKIKTYDQVPEGETFDLVLANIGFKELKKLAMELKKVASSKGTVYFLSGVLKEDMAELKKHYQSLGYRFLSSQTFKEWSFLAFKFFS